MYVQPLTRFITPFNYDDRRGGSDIFLLKLSRVNTVDPQHIFCARPRLENCTKGHGGHGTRE